MAEDLTTDGEPGAIGEVAGDARTALLLAADDDPLADECCVALSAADDPAETRLLSVTVGSPPDGRLATWRTHAGGLPTRTGIIAVGESTRSAAADGGTVAPGTGPVSVDVVEDPSDLAGIALAIRAYLEAWDDGNDHGGGAAGPVGGPATSTSLCLHSLSELLEVADIAHVFRFLHATFGLLRRHGATAHVHLDPDAHDDAAVNTLCVLFDAVVRVGADGSVTVDSG